MKLVAEALIRLIWKTSSLWSICEHCLEAVLKCLVTVMCALVTSLVDSILCQHPLPPSPSLLLVAKSGLLCFHHIWAFDDPCFARAISTSPKIQRRYVWTINHLLDLRKNKYIHLEYGNYNFLHLKYASIYSANVAYIISYFFADYLITDLDLDRDD